MTSETVRSGRGWRTAGTRSALRSVGRWSTVAFLATLILLPTDIGLHVVGVVWTPARSLLVLALATAVLGGQLGVESVRREPRWILLGWLLFLGAAGLTTVLQPGPGATSRWISMVLEGLGVYLLLRAVVVERRDAALLLATMVAATVVVAGGSMLASLAGVRYDQTIAGLLGGAGSGPLGESRFGLLRQGGSFPAPLFLAVWLAACGVVASGWMARPTGRRSWLAVAAWLVMSAAIVTVTVSRIAITGVLLLTGAHLATWRRWLASAVLVAAGILVGVGFAGLTITSSLEVPAPSTVPGGSPTPSASPPTQTDEEAIAGSSALRLAAVRGSAMAIAERPLLGWGLLRAKEVVSAKLGSVNHVDSTYLVVAVEMGLLGLAGLAMLAGAIARAGRGAWRDPLGRGVAIALVAILGMSLLAAFLAISQGYALTAALAACYVASSSIARGEGGISGSP